MKFEIQKNQELDIEVTKGFYRMGEPIIREHWPQLRDVSDIEKNIKNVDERFLDKKIEELKLKEYELQEISEAISLVIGEDWKDIREVKIYVGTCPICPRFLDDNSFLVPYYRPTRVLLNISAHEMVHFLYFQKWAKLFPEYDKSEYEHPHPVWILSEILAPVIGNDPRISKLAGKFDVYPWWQEKKFDNKYLLEIFSPIYLESKNYDDFLRDSWQKFLELDKKYNLTKSLT